MIYVPGCRLLIKPLKLEETDKTMRSAVAAGIVIPEQEKRKHESQVDQGVVLQIGPEASKAYIEGVKVGSTIGFAKFGGKFVKDYETNETLLVINDEDVICVFNKE